MTPVLAYVLDEHLRGPLWHAIQQHNANSPYPIDVVRVGDPLNLPLGTVDPDILVWAEQERRLFVSFDKSSLPGHLQQHLQNGRRSPGILIIRPVSTIALIVDYLVHAGYAGNPADYEDGITYIP